MKKLYSALLVMALAIVMVLPVMAAPSPLAESKAARNTARVPVQGATVTVLSKGDYDGVMAVVTNQEHLTNLGVGGNSKVLSVFDLKFSIPAGQSSVTIPVGATNARPGDYVVVLHRQDNPQKTWEKVGEGYVDGNGIINCTFTSFSPVVVLTANAPSAATGTVKAPKTGQN